MIWIVLHWVFLYVCKPHTLFHGITCIVTFIFQVVIRKKKIKWKKNIQNSLGVVLMYIGFYISEEIYHFSFLPFWALSIVGMRKNLLSLFIFSVVTGTVLNFIVLKQVIGHVIMNVGRIIRIEKVSFDNVIISHGCLFIVGSIIQSKELVVTKREVLAVISSIHMINKIERMDLFSLCMCYTNIFTLLCSILHIFVPNWYNFYMNNHFYIVKNQYMFFIPIGILIQRIAYSFFY